jgi:hypothetical protein
MLNEELWTSFEKSLTASDVVDIEKRLGFLHDILEDAITQYHVEDVRSELDLNLHIYLAYFETAGNTNLSPWLIHESWFNYYKDGCDLNPALEDVLKEAFLQPEVDLYLDITNFLRCLKCDRMIAKEVDAVVWLSFLDYMASRLIYRMGQNRMAELFHRGKTGLYSG